jgi:hypothetical protein
MINKVPKKEKAWMLIVGMATARDHIHTYVMHIEKELFLYMLCIYVHRSTVVINNKMKNGVFH